MELDFAPSDDRVLGMITDQDIVIDHLKVFDGEKEITAEEHILQDTINQKIEKAKQNQKDTGYAAYIPIYKYPGFQECLGLNVNKVFLELEEGFVRFSYKLEVKSA